ncbi:MAG: hypothetical protein AB9897_02375 [Anaerolineaceae bacterium]
MYGKRNAFKLLSVLLIFGLLFAAVPAGHVKAASEIVYNSLLEPLPGNVASVGFQATQTSEFGDYIHLGGTNRLLKTVTVTMSTWALQSSYYPALDHPGGWDHPITLNIYNVVEGSPLNSVGSLIATKTQTFTIPWRPEADPTCGTPTQWRASNGTCYNGYAFNITFDLSSLLSVLPNDIVVGIAFNTNTWGYSPIGLPGPYESLNVGAEGLATVGTDDNTDNVFMNTVTAAWYSDGGAGGVGIFREDTNWGAYGTLPLQITAAPSVPAVVCVNSAWTAVAPGTDPDGSGPAEAMGFDAFTTITAGITAVAPGGIVNVAGGTYDEKVTVNKAVTLQGAGSDSTKIQPTASGNYSLFSVTNPGGDVKIDGFNFMMPVFPAYGSAVSVTDTAGAIDANTVTISNNIVTGTNDGNTGTDFGFYGQGNNAKFVVLNNVLNYTGSNSIMMEQQLGSSIITGNTVRISNDVFYDPIFSMIYGNKDVVTPQIISGNTIYLQHAGDGYSTAITFNVAPPYAPDPKDGHYRDIQILNNTIYTGGDDARGIAVSDRASGSNSQITGVVITGNAVIGANKSDANTRGILVNGNVQNAIISNNDISNVLTGIVVSAGAGNGIYPNGTTIERNKIVNTTSGVSWSNTATSLDASPNWWGSIAGPASGNITGLVTFAPWCADEGCTTLMPVDGVITLPDGISSAEIQDAIDNAPSGTTIIIPAGTYNFSGGYHMDTPHLTIFLKNGVTIQNSSPCFVVNADYTTVTTESIGGAKCVPTDYASGIEVSAGRLNVIIQGLEIDGTGQNTTNGVNFAGAITDVQVLNNYIHDLDGSGVAFVAQPAGTVDIQGNLIKANTGVGVSSPSSLNATYNSWGSYASPTTTGAVTFAPYTHVDVSMTSSGTPWANRVLPGYTITYTVKGNFQNAMGADFKLLYPSSLLSVSSTSMGSYFTIPATTNVLDTTTAGVISFAGYATTAVSGSDLTLYTVTFTAASTGALGVLDLDATTDAFAMAPAGGPSNNIYANALSDGAVDVITALPTMSATGLDVSFAQGYAQEFHLIVNNPLAGVEYANPQLQFTLPAGTVLEYFDGSSWTTVAGTTLNLTAPLAAGDNRDMLFRASFPAAGNVTVAASLVDTYFTPAAVLATFSQTGIVVNPNVTLLGTFSMQGRVNRAGMPVTISSILYGLLNSTTVDLISNNISFSNVAWATYTITTNQARYLNVTSDLGKTIAVTGSKTTINPLELKGGNAVYSDNEINVADASKVGTDYGKIGASFDGDVNFSNKVDIFDLAIVGGNYGFTSTTAYGTWVP